MKVATLAMAATMAAIGVPAVLTAQAAAPADFTAADVSFMQGMIAHHAQAVIMARLATTHGANPRVLLFCKKVALSQTGEIRYMQNWLRARNVMVPQPDTVGDTPMDMPGMDMSHAMMPGMLTAAQLKELEQSRDTTFDRLFLQDMIQHHRGALRMVNELFDSPGGGQQADLFDYANGVMNDQQAEILVMQKMLTTYTGSKQE